MTRAPSPTLAQIPANTRLVEELHAHGQISREAKAYALDVLYPADKWGAWISRILLVVGASLVLCGLVFFFAFNWAKISPMIKLSTVQIGILACLIGAYISSLKQLSGQVLLLSASVLTGIFLAVFGQIYQTGADAYQLFTMWSVLILGWTVISKFAPQWVFWLVITNIGLVLWWDQSALPERHMQVMICVYLSLLNGAALGLREYVLVKKNQGWIQGQWVRILLVLAILVPLTIPVMIWILDPANAFIAIVLSSLWGLLGHAVLYVIYRYKLSDAWSISLLVVSFAIIAETLALKLVGDMNSLSESMMFLLMGIVTIAVFTAAVFFLRKIIASIEVDHH